MRAQQQRHVLHGAPHRPLGGQLGDEGVRSRPRRHAALRWPKTKHIVPGSRVAQAAHEVRAIGHRQHVRGQRHRRAATAAARRARQVIRVAGDAKHVVESVRAQSKLGHIGFANDDAAGRLHALGHQAIFRRHKVAHQRRALHGGNARRVGEILDGLRHAVHPAHRLAARQLRITRLGLAQQIIAILQADDGVHLRVDIGNALQIGLHHLAAGELLAVDGLGQRVGA